MNKLIVHSAKIAIWRAISFLSCFCNLRFVVPVCNSLYKALIFGLVILSYCYTYYFVNSNLQMVIVLCLTQSASMILATNISRLFLESLVVRYVENKVWLPRLFHRALNMTPSLNI